jgi:hypothetical protein
MADLNMANQIRITCRNCDYHFVYGFEKGSRTAPEKCPKCSAELPEPPTPADERTPDQKIAELHARLAAAEAALAAQSAKTGPVTPMKQADPAQGLPKNGPNI